MKIHSPWTLGKMKTLQHEKTLNPSGLHVVVIGVKKYTMEMYILYIIYIYLYTHINAHMALMHRYG